MTNARQGEVAIALRELDAADIMEGVPTDAPVSDIPDKAVETLMLVALAQNDTDRALALMRRHLDVEIGGIIRNINTDTASALATLENSRERQAERAAAAARELALREATIRKQRILNRMLMLLSALLLLGAISAVAFARYRDKISKALAIKTEEAESADRMKSEFLGMISHELRTPLNGIIGISDLLAHTHPDPDIRKKTGIVLKSGTDLFNVIERIIDMSRIEGGKLELYPDAFNLSEIIRDTAEAHRDAATAKGLLYTVHVDPTVETFAMCDREKLAQGLCHLIENAVRFTDAGRIHVHATATRTDATTSLTVIVADTGMGMTEEVQSRLFTPFLQADASMTRKFGGSGLSLAISREMLRRMDGDVTVVSRTGAGSEFTLTAQFATASAPVLIADSPSEIQLKDTPVETVVEPRETQAAVLDLMASDVLHQPPITTPELSGLRVLLIEDVASNRDILRILLEPLGCLVAEAENGRDGLDHIERHPVDLVLLDIHMPGLSGIEVAKRIRTGRHTRTNVPIVALTADSEAETNAACLAAGADLFLTKPVVREELVDAITFIRERYVQSGATPGLLRA